MSESTSGQIDTVMIEDRLFPPSEEFASKCAIGSMEAYQTLYDEAKANPEAFWDKLAKAELHWFKPYDTVLEWQVPNVKWFVGGKTNVSYNCLDVHLATRAAIKQPSFGKASRATRERSRTNNYIRKFASSRMH